MAISRLTTVAKENGSLELTVALTGANGAAVTPLTFLWTWTDTIGNVINSRQNVAVTGGDLGEEITIKLNGDDLPVAGVAQAVYVLSVLATYLDADGDTKNITDAVEVPVDRIIGFGV